MLDNKWNQKIRRKYDRVKSRVDETGGDKRDRRRLRNLSGKMEALNNVGDPPADPPNAGDPPPVGDPPPSNNPPSNPLPGNPGNQDPMVPAPIGIPEGPPPGWATVGPGGSGGNPPSIGGPPPSNMFPGNPGNQDPRVPSPFGPRPGGGAGIPPFGMGGGNGQHPYLRMMRQFMASRQPQAGGDGGFQFPPFGQRWQR